MQDKKALRLYLIIVLSVSAVIEAVWIYLGEAASLAGISTLLMMVPFITAAIVGRIYYKKQRAMGFKRCRFVHVLLSILIPLIYLMLSYALFWLFTGSYNGHPSALMDAAAAYSGHELPKNVAIAISLAVTLPVSFITALGEEAGWRGLMHPIMHRIWGWKKAIIISGCVWALWHLPIVVAGLYYPSEISLVYVIPMFIVEIAALTIILSWLRMASGSVWPAVILHAVHNYLDQIVFQSFTSNENSVYYVGEIGIITLSLTVIAAVIILVKGRKAFTLSLDS